MLIELRKWDFNGEIFTKTPHNFYSLLLFASFQTFTFQQFSVARVALPWRLGPPMGVRGLRDVILLLCVNNKGLGEA